MFKLTIYALKDKLLEHFMQPFMSPGEKEAMSALSTLINDEESKHAATQSPRDFALYQLGHVTEEGQVYGDFRIVCEAAGLVRDRVRNRPAPTDSALPRAVELSAEQTRYGVDN